MKRREEQPPRERLEAAVAEYRRLHEGHRRAHPGGHTQRRLERRLAELAAEVEHVLAAAELEEDDRAAWRRHLHDGAPAPELPAAAPPGSAHSGRHPRNRRRGSAPLWQR